MQSINGSEVGSVIEPNFFLPAKTDQNQEPEPMVTKCAESGITFKISRLCGEVLARKYTMTYVMGPHINKIASLKVDLVGDKDGCSLHRERASVFHLFNPGHAVTQAPQRRWW